MNVKITKIKNKVGFVERLYMELWQIEEFINNNYLRKLGNRYVNNDGYVYHQLEILGGK